jgi:hypothetical protein
MKDQLLKSTCIVSTPNIEKSHWVLGMHDSQLQDGIPYKIADYQLHPKFTNYSIYDDYDMAIVAVDRSIVFSENIKPVCLPSPSDDFTGQMAVRIFPLSMTFLN